MKYQLLGKSGLRVSEICLGTMTFGDDWGWGGAKEECKKQFDTFAEAGGNFIDTANLYTNGSSEKIVGEFIGADRGRWVLATKYSLGMGDDVNASGNHYKNMVQAVEASLQRLKTDYIDLYWLHVWDFTTPVEEIMRGFDDLRRAGKILYAGISDTPAWRVSEANTIAMFRGWSPFIGLQIEYSLRERTPERDLIPMAAAHGMTVTAWSPLGGGVLSGKYGAKKPEKPQEGQRQEGAVALSERDLQIGQEVVAVAKEIGKSPAQVAINWIRQRPGHIIPILGARKHEQFVDNLGVLDWELPKEQVERLDRASRIELGFPHDFLVNPMVREFAFRGSLAKIRNPADPLA